jgi:hypothetical protein
LRRRQASAIKDVESPENTSFNCWLFMKIHP